MAENANGNQSADATQAAGDGGAAAAGQVLGFASPALASVEGYTGRYIVMAKGGKDGKTRSILQNEAGLKIESVTKADAPDIGAKSIAEDEGLLFPELGVAVVNPAGDNLGALSAAVAQNRQTLASNVQEIGSVAETYTPDGPPLTVIGDAEGGALVVGSMSTVSTVTITLAGAKLTLSPYESAAAGAAEAGTSLARTYTDVLVFHVPAAGSGQQVQLIAAEAVLTAVSAQ